MKTNLPDPEKIITDVENQLKKILRRYRLNFFLQQNVVPLFSTLLPRIDFIARRCLHNMRFLRPDQLKIEQIIKNKKLDQKKDRNITLVSANILQGMQGIGKEAFFCRFWNSIFFEKFPSPWLEKIFAKDIDASLQRICDTGKIDFLALQEVFSADAEAVELWLKTHDFSQFYVSDSWHVFVKKYNVSTMISTQKNIVTSVVKIPDHLKKMYDQVQKLSWGINMVELVDHQIFLLNLHAPLIAVRRQLFWNQLSSFLCRFWNSRQKLILMGDFNASPTEIRKFLKDVTQDLFLFDLPTFQMDKPPISMKLDNCVFLGFKDIPFNAKATTHDIGSDHRALRVELVF